MNQGLVIIPTYNEKENIEILIREILTLNLPLDILVIDDNSPDGTGQILENLKSQISQLQIIHREQKAGLASAYITGFKYALAKGYDYIFQMDADLSHQPKFLPNLWAKLQARRWYKYLAGIILYCYGQYQAFCGV